MTYYPKQSRFAELNAIRKKCKKRIIEYSLYILVTLALFFSSGMPNYLERAIFYDKNPDVQTTQEILESAYYAQNPFAQKPAVSTSKEKYDAISLVYLFTAVSAILCVLFFFLLIKNIRLNKTCNLKLQQLHSSFLTIEDDKISGTCFISETATAEHFALHPRDITGVSYGFNLLNLIIQCGDKEYRCLELENPRMIREIIIERSVLKNDAR